MLADFKITTATKKDIPEICRVHKTAWLATYATDIFGLSQSDILTKDFDSPAKINNWHDSLDDDNFKLWVATIDKQIIGFCGGKKLNSHNDFSVVYILPEHQRKGIGKALAKAALNWLIEDKPLKVEVAKENKNAISFYKSLGFGKELPSNPVILTNGKKIDIIKMYLEKNGNSQKNLA